MVATTAREKATTLVEALPYLRAHRGATTVLKVGGEILLEPERAAALAHDVALLHLVGVRIVVVHGGGPQVSAAARASGVEPVFVDGLRVTDDAAMRTAQAVFLGEINPGLVRALSAAGVPATGLAGGDGGLFTAEPIPHLGNVGAITGCNGGLLASLLASGYVPVVAPLAPDAHGRLLNVNADAIAAAVSVAMRADKLVYMTNVEGLYRDFGDEGSLVSEIRADDLRVLSHTLSEGMRPKVEGALGALDGGVGRVHLLDGRVEHALLLELFTPEGVGTVILP